MSGSLEHLQELLNSKEDEHLELKEAKHDFDFEKLVKYCVALANEGGGSMVLRVTNKKPRKVVGTRAFVLLERTKAGLIERLRPRIETEEMAHPDGRVLVFRVPPRPIGMPAPDFLKPRVQCLLNQGCGQGENKGRKVVSRQLA